MKTTLQYFFPRYHIGMICLMFLLEIPAFGTTYYVATNGVDTNPGTSALPYATIQMGLSMAQPGDTVSLAAGTYRQSPHFVRSGTLDHSIGLRATGSAKVIIQGSALVTGFTLSSGSTYVKTGWTTYFPPNDPNQTDARKLPRDQMFVDGTYIPEATSVATMTAGSFYDDHTNSKLYLWLAAGDNPSSHQVEADNSESILSDTGFNYIVIQDLQFQYCANQPQLGMVKLAGSNCTIRNCIFQYAAGAGLFFNGNNILVQSCQFNNNTQEGFSSSSCNSVTMEDCISNDNNTEPDKTFDSGWEAGACKISRSTNYLLENHSSTGNKGPGVWFDIDNEHATIKGCFSTGNTEGIQYEISYTALIINNICTDNSDCGFLISSSAGNYVANNLAYANINYGITNVDSTQGPRSDGNGGFVYCYANTFYNNIVADNQIAGNQKSYVVSSATTVNPAIGSTPVVPFTPNVSDYNLFYYSGPAEPFFIDTKDHYEPDTLALWQAHNGFDLHSIWAKDPAFVSPSTGDFYPKAGAPEIDSGITLSKVTVDFDGTARPQGAGYDMGPYEYVP